MGYGSTLITPGSAYGDGETDAHGRETLTSGLADWNGSCSLYSHCRAMQSIYRCWRLTLMLIGVVGFLDLGCDREIGSTAESDQLALSSILRSVSSGYFRHRA